MQYILGKKRGHEACSIGQITLRAILISSSNSQLSCLHFGCAMPFMPLTLGTPATGQEHCWALQLLPGEPTEPKAWSIRVSPKRFPAASSNHVESSNGHGAVEFEASGGRSIYGSCSNTISCLCICLSRRHHS